MKTTAIVILNWNGRKYLEAFLPAVVEHSLTDGVSIYVADNASTDDSIAYLNQNFPHIQLILLDRNYGFAEGYNRALKQISADYFVLLNSDVEVSANWLVPILDYMNANNDVAACMPKIKSYADRNKFEYAGAAGGFIDRFGYPFCRGRILSSIEADEAQYEEVTEIFWATGACLFVRASLYFEAGGLDRDFFAHMEEIDLCWRLKNMNYRIMYIPHVEVFHVGGGTLPNNTPRKLYLNHRNNLMLLFKNLPTATLVPTLLTRMLLDGISAVLYLGNFSFAFFFAVLRAHLSFYKSVSILCKKRREFKNKHRLLAHKQMYAGSIVFSFFVKKKQKFTQLHF